MPTSSFKEAMNVLWLRVAGLAALHGAITTTWIVYNLYLPQLLAQFGFPLALAQTILVVENLLAAAVEPTMGALSDRAAQRRAGRLAFLSRGVLLSAFAFVVIPLVAVAWQPTGAGRWLLPLVLILWALTMTAVRTPSLSLLKQSASDPNLPRAAALITVVSGLFSAIRPVSTGSILRLGPLMAFVIGSGVLLLSTWIVGQLYSDSELEPVPDLQVHLDAEPGSLPGLSPHLLTLFVIFGVGVGGAWSALLSARTVSQLLADYMPEANTTGLMSLFFFLLACAALPLGMLASKMGNRKLMLIGAASAAFGLGIVALDAFGVNATAYLWPLTVALVLVGLSVLTTGAAPFALSAMRSLWGGLGVGVYFGGFTFATGLFHAALAPRIGAASLSVLTLLAAGSFLICCFFLMASLSTKSPHASGT